MSEAVDTAAWRLAAELARSRSETQAAAAVARAVAGLAGCDMARVWMIDHAKGYRCSGSYPAEETPPERIPEEVPRVAALGTAIAVTGPRPVRSRLILPLVAGRKPLGAIELLERKRAAGAYQAADAAPLAPLLDAADAVLEGIRERGTREIRSFEAITRLTRLMDVGRTLASTFDMDELVRLIANRVRVSLEAEGAYLWLAAGESVRIAAAEGPAAEAVAGWELPLGEGIAGSAASSGEAQLLNDPDEIAALGERPDAQAGLEIRTVAAVPITAENGTLIGIIEVVNRETDEPLDDGDVSFLRLVAETSAVCVGNVRRLKAERQATDLSSLLEIAQELGTSLEVSKVTFTLVHKAALVLQYRQAAAGLLRPGGRFELAAVSGSTFVDEKLPQVRALREILEWASGLPEGIYVVQEEDGSLDTPRMETREKFQAYFQMTGTRSFLTIPLTDDVGRVGIFSLESVEPYAFGEQAMEASRLLAVQATIAIRNAMLYQQVPMARIFQPLARHQQRFANLPFSRRAMWLAGLALVAVALLLPVPLRVSGEARVLPARRLPVASEVEGRILKVFVREGDRVDAGQVLALLDDTDYRMGEEDARARFEMAQREETRLRAVARTADAAVETARVDGIRAELELWRRRLDSTQIRARHAGIVATPRVEERVGTALAQGEPFCEIVDPGHQRLEVMLPEDDTGLVEEGMAVKVKLHAYPTRSLRARVERVGVVATLLKGERYFLIQARLEGSGTVPRSGMTGLAKIYTGRAPAVRVMLRRPARWLWQILWGWLP